MSKDKILQEIKNIIDGKRINWTDEQRTELVKILFQNGSGDILLSRINLSNFDGDVFISNWIVKNNLYQCWQQANEIIQDNNKANIIYQSTCYNFSKIVQSGRTKND